MNRSWHWQMQKHPNFARLADNNSGADRSCQSSSAITATMDRTTLVAFLFKAPPEARTVELLGSWDNFSHPYRMHHDRRKGTGYWSGCFKFHNIIFDGDSSNWIKPRTGGLKQGGTYWYYYRLNDEVEAYDDSKEYTTTCPLLPGQPVNHIEVPVEIIDPPPRCRSASLSVVGTIASLPSTHTLDPDDKFNPLDPPPVSKVHERCVSDLALNRRLEAKAQSFRDSIISPPTSPRPEPEQSHSPADRPTERFYGTGNYAYDPREDERSSLYSRRSWRSAAPSFAHSSIVDAYGAESHAFDIDSCDLFSACENSALGPVTTVPYEDYDQFAFNIPNESAASDHVPEAMQAGDETSWDNTAGISGFNFSDSRPTTSYSRTDSQQQMFTTPQNDFDHLIEPSDWPLGSGPSPLPSTEQCLEAEQNSFDNMLSPTFSAATLSSCGLSTPLRLSLGCSRTVSTYTNHDDSIEVVAERLRRLGLDEHESIPPIHEGDESVFTGYALPEPETIDSTQSVGKAILAYNSTLYELQPPSLMQESQDSSFADAIFNELGFLGGSISVT